MEDEGEPQLEYDSELRPTSVEPQLEGAESTRPLLLLSLVISLSVPLDPFTYLSSLVPSLSPSVSLSPSSSLFMSYLPAFFLLCLGY